MLFQNSFILFSTLDDRFTRSIYFSLFFAVELFASRKKIRMSKRMLLNIVTNERVPFSKFLGSGTHKENISSDFIFLKQNVSIPKEPLKRYKKIEKMGLTSFEKKNVKK